MFENHIDDRPGLDEGVPRLSGLGLAALASSFRSIRLLVCDDSPEARAALRTMLAEQPEIEIVGEANNGREAIELASALSPDVILMDVAMPVLDGVSATRTIRELLPAARIVAFAGSSEREVVSAMLEAGANAYCVKGAPLWELERAIAGASDPLVRLAHDLAKAANSCGAGELVARELAELTGGTAAVYFAEPEMGLSLAGMAGEAPRDGLISAPGLVVRSFRERAAVGADVRELSEFYRADIPCAEALAVPLLSDGEAVGALVAVMPPNIQLRIDPELVFAVADLAAAAVANQRRMALTFAEARRDAVTGLPNRRAFEERLDELLAGSPRRRAAVALFDIDDFKRINDAKGHLAGDDVLREVGRVLQRSLRADEEVYRVGGDELAIVIAGGTEAMGHVATRLRTCLATHRRRGDLPTISGGVATFPDDAATKADLLCKADVALYAAKRAGKNQVVVYRTELEDVHYGAGSEATDTNEGAALVSDDEPAADLAQASDGAHTGSLTRRGPTQLLVVDDDVRLRMLLRTTLEVIDIEVEEAATAAEARAYVAAGAPDLIVLDVGLPDENGLSLCTELKADPRTKGIPVVVLTGLEAGTAAEAERAGADAYLRKPFSPLELLGLVERLAGGLYEGPFRAAQSRPPDEQLILYAEDLRHLLDIERGQRSLLQQAYRQTVTALAAALESKDTGTGAHSHRVRTYARELTDALDPALLDDASLEYGFLLHDIGKIGVPDSILQKPGALTPSERRVLQTHTVLGEQMLSGVALLDGEGLKVVRHHHERWDGRGYPDGLSGAEIPLGARIFAVADALDAMTSDRPYRPAGSWGAAVGEIAEEAGHQFDPRVVEALEAREAPLRRIYYELTAV
jgi:ribonuclease P protein subunit RPR2